MSGLQPFNLKAYPPVFLNRDSVNIEAGDKIVLHSDVLDNLNKAYPTTLPHPLLFEIRNQKVGRVSHCGVLEFSADERAAYLPQWMMENLCLNSGDPLQFRLKTQIPKATALTFKPNSKSFAKLPTPKETLEYALSKFTVATEGDNITITHGNQSHSLTVTKVAPRQTEVNPAVNLLNTSVTVEFEMSESAVDSKAEDEVVFEPIELEEQKRSVVGVDKYVHYRVKAVDPNSSLKLTITSDRGDPDLFVDTNDTPTLVKNIWSTVKTPNTEPAKNGEKVTYLVIDKDDMNFVTNWYYIAVYGYKEEASFVIEASETTERNEEKMGATTGSANTDPNAKQCSNCLAYVPQQRFMMHEMSCARNNWRCTVCNKVFRPSSKDTHIHCPKCNVGLHKDGLQKHLDLMHRKVACACGMEFEPDLFSLHQKEECMLRMQTCKYCHMNVIASELKQHEDFCGSKSAPCDMCGQEVPRKRMSHHKASEHGINPSLYKNPGFGRQGGHNDPPPMVQPSRPAPLPTSGFQPGAFDQHRNNLGPDMMQRQTTDDMVAAAMAESARDYNEQDDDALQQALMASMGMTSSTSSSSSTSTTNTSSSSSSTPALTPAPSGPSETCAYCGTVVPGTYDDLLGHLSYCDKAG